MPEFAAAPCLDDLIEQVTTWPVGMPVRAMERVLAAGESAIGPLADALSRWQDDEQRDLLWPIVLLGELRHPAGIGPLAAQVRRPDEETLALAAAEGLAKIGAPALPALHELSTESNEVVRLFTYAALGWIQDDQAYQTLIDALARDRSLGDVIALALGEQGRPDAIPHLYAAYRTCEPWQRIEFTDTIADLHWGRRHAPHWIKNWRLRYRRMPSLGGLFDLGWPIVAATVRRHSDELARREVPPVRALEEIVRHQPKPEEDDGETCENCGEPVEYPTGLPVCPESAVGLAMYQLSLLNWAQQEGLDDLFDLLDNVEDREWEQYEAGEPSRRAARTRLEEKRDDLAVFRQTCTWLVEQGIERVSPAKALLLAEVGRLTDRFGAPPGLFDVPRATPTTAARIGRNDPCPCGSGKKYKKCCLAAGPS